ncbi:MetQ/NlpA family ABC transporter substrate-binding protein [Ideonella azotifigens]|uniref:MetQ/NlpA family ABC transporter substrate-binding protein n=1 Tax=Ideonella azotifigens TaxID=513160 RepID=A0ABP3V8Z7_9BURK|nr:MetQ/NlpA family ABC transporter substrate-binding protein [Ideonella azotifigens]MCD2341690.1 MetQ/NlpA family ABC transporter substrate-binding protein [Ideonella azotifigens]
MSLDRRLFLSASMASLASAAWPAAPLRIGTVPGPQAEVLGLVRDLAPQGLQLQLEVREHGRALNADLARGALDAVSFEDGVAFAADPLRGQLASASATLTLPMALYSRRLRSLRQLAQGDTLVLPRDQAGLSRGLLLLHNHGVITLRDDSGLHAKLADVVVNRLALRLQTQPAAKLFAALDRAALVVIGAEDAMAAGLQPARDSLGLEDARSPYAGVLAVRRQDKDSPWVAQLVAAYHAEPVKAFLLSRYQGSVRRPW